MLWAKTCVYICSGRAGGNERDLLFYVRYEEPCPHPTPPHPNPTPPQYLRSIDQVCKLQGTWCYVAPTMCASARNVIIPTPPHPNPTPPQYLRSIDQVCKLQGTWCYVAPTMCASARNVIIPTPPPPVTSYISTPTGQEFPVNLPPLGYIYIYIFIDARERERERSI